MGRRGEAQSGRLIDVPTPTRSMDTVCAVIEVYVLSIRRLDS